MTCKLGRIWKEPAVTQSETLPWPLSEGTERTTTNLILDIRSSDRDLNLGRIKYEAGVLTIRFQRLMTV